MQRLDRFQNTAVVSHESFNKTILRVGAETLLMAIFISSCNLCLHYGQKNYNLYQMQSFDYNAKISN